MTKDEVFRAWAPGSAAWTRWAKPVLLAHAGVVGSSSEGTVSASEGEETMAALTLSRVVPEDTSARTYRTPSRSASVALVVELPGALSVHAGVALARLGFRPVPLFNAYPAAGSRGVVDVWPVVNALTRGAVPLAALALHDDAPPAFLLDANRRGATLVNPRLFDNRSVCTRSDFPTGAVLVAHGIDHVVVVRERTDVPIGRDLSIVLAAHEDAGLKIHEVTTSDSRAPILIRVPRPPWFARLAEALYRWSLGRSDEGAFGRAHTS